MVEGVLWLSFDAGYNCPYHLIVLTVMLGFAITYLTYYKLIYIYINKYQTL